MQAKFYSVLDNIKAKTFFVILFIYQLFFIFQGVDFTDEGFYGTFYQQIFKSPQSVQYNFMYWLSGIIGGTYLYLFPSYGLLAIRLGGVIVTTLTIIITYAILKKYIAGRYLKLGLLLATIMLSNDPKSMFYDNLSALFFVIMVYFLFEGLKNNKLSSLFFCGVFLSLNTFTKLSNIADAALGATLLYAAYLNKTTLKYILIQAGVYVSGFVITTLVLLLVMQLMGHLTIFINCITLVKEMGKSSENTHGLLKLIKLFRYEYSHAIIYGVITLLALILGALALNVLTRKRNSKWLSYLLGFLGWIVAFFLTAKNFFFNPYILLNIVTGLCLIAALFIVLNNRVDKNIKILAFTGVIMTIILPFGSDFGMYAAGKYALWIALPIATYHYLSLHSFPSNINWGRFTINADKFFIPARQLRFISICCAGIFVVLFVFIGITHTWQDFDNRAKMTYQVNNEFLKGIFTNEKKAATINDLLKASKQYVKKDDYVLAYDEIPLFYAMTQTRPFMRNSWTKLYDREVFRSELEKDLAEKKIFPVVVYQKMMTLNTNWPQVSSDDKQWDLNQPRNLYLKQFLDSNHYKIAWENIAFRIYIPPTK